MTRDTAFAAVAGVIVAAYLLLAWPGTHGPFVFDDFPNLAPLAKFGTIDTWRELGQYLSESRFFPGRPLAMLSFLPQQAHWPDDPAAFKAVNLALHALNAVLLGWLLLRVTRAWAGAEASRWIAVVAALAWLIHPMQLTTVFLVVQRMTLLSTLFMLLGLLAYVHGATSPQRSTRVRAAWMGVGIGAGTLLALLCKENGILLPLYALALDATLLREPVQAMPVPLRRWRALLLYPALAALAAFLLWHLPHWNDPLPGRDFTVHERLLTQPRVLLTYLGDTLLPRYAHYGVFHDDFVVSRGLLSPWTTAAALAALLGALALAVVQRRSRPLLSFAIFWYLGGHLLEAGPLSLEIYFEHRNYLPIAGPIFAVVAAIARLPEGGARPLLRFLGGAWMGYCLLAVALYAQVWAKPDKLAFFWADAHPTSIRAQTLYAQSLYEHGLLEPARDVIEALAVARPDEPGPATTMLYIDCALGRATAADVSALAARLRTARWARDAFEGLGSLRELAVRGTCEALDDRAWLGLTDALLANPAYNEPVAGGTLHYQRHELAVARGQLDRAIAELDATARFDPDPEVVRLQARYLAEAGLREQAIGLLEAYDGSHRPLLRRWLVDDVAIDRELAQQLRKHGAQ
jgi:hypothetical protein